MAERKHDSDRYTIAQAQAAGADLLRSAGVSEPRLDAGSLLAHALEQDRTYVIIHRDDTLSREQLERFQILLGRRATGEPLQYLTGHQEFYKLNFEVTPDVLIPRPETELIVEAALERVNRKTPISLLDVGTGSGCIVISLLNELPNAQAVATDISSNALQVAERNAQHHGVRDRLALVQADSLTGFGQSNAFSLIVSNPPYIPAADIETLQREVREHEPLAALVSGADGLDHVRALLREAAPLLRANGHFVFEIGIGQSEAVEQLIDRATWRLLEVKLDLQAIPRTVVLQRK